MTRPRPEGRCPGAWRPMRSGDGLVVRVRPRLARLTADQALGLCEASERHGNGIIDLTSRANLQIRGVSEAGHGALLNDLNALALLDDDPALERRRNILITPLWEAGDLSHRLAVALEATLAELPEMPAKVGYSIDAGQAAMPGDCSADFRFELSDRGALMLRADGSANGWPIDPDAALPALVEMAGWFCETGGPASGRMARHLESQALPARWRSAPRRVCGRKLTPGSLFHFRILGVPFGKMEAKGFSALVTNSGARAVRVTPWRMLLLENAGEIEGEGEGADAGGDFITSSDDRLLSVSACPGAPFCSSASVETRKTARRLAPFVNGTLHVSGCAKGCARPRPAAVTLIGREGLFDLVSNGHSWDAPQETGLSARALLSRLGATT